MLCVGAFLMLSPRTMLGPDTRATASTCSKFKTGLKAIDVISGSHQNGKHLVQVAKSRAKTRRTTLRKRQ